MRIYFFEDTFIHVLRTQQLHFCTLIKVEIVCKGLRDSLSFKMYRQMNVDLRWEVFSRMYVVFLAGVV